MKQYAVVQKAIEMVSKTTGLVDSETAERMVAYQADGVYGENAKKDLDPKVDEEAY